MKKDLSAYLDVLRILAAMIVFLGHLSWRSISGGFFWQIQSFGHSAVIVFFVLSGFVVQFSVDKKEGTLTDYLVARFARIYSVVLPAILLTVVCDRIGIHHNSHEYDLTREDTPIYRVLLGVVFLTQSWQHVSLLSNEPFWSLPYEFWYYQIFGAAIFLKGWRRIAAVLIGCAVAGPAILLEFPLWIAGVAAYRLSKSFAPSSNHARVLWFVSACGVLIAILNNQHPIMYSSAILPTTYSRLDYVIALLFAVNIFAASNLNFGLAKAHPVIARVAGMTFALYLFHLPLLRLIAAYLPSGTVLPVRGLEEFAGALAVIPILAVLTEGQKRRLRTWLYWIVQRRDPSLTKLKSG